MPKKTEENKQAEINIGLVGHVDHGKTTLTKALSGKWTDTHSEELKRGISIRLGYADTTFYKCPSCKGSEAYTTKEKCPNCEKKAKELRRVSFVDAPGHEILMTTMLSGAALMQGAILVIAANEECPQPRTIEHLMALSIGGVKNIVVAQNKVDLVSREEAIENQQKIKKFLKEFGYEKSPIIPISATFGINVDLLIETIEKTIKTPKFDKKKPFKMYTVRTFDINKPGTKPKDLKGGVLGGSLLQGEIKKGDEIEITPGIGTPLKTKVINLSTSTGNLTKAHPGGLIAIETQLDPSIAKNDELKGQTVCKPGSLSEPTKKINLEIKVLKRLLIDQDVKIHTNDTLVLTIGTMTAIGAVTKKLKQDKFEITLKNPVVAEKDQRLAISKRYDQKWRLVAYATVQ